MKNLYLRVARWIMVLVGGAMIGGGLVLHAQIAVGQHMRDEVGNTFWLWRGIGRMTFWLQGDVTQTAIALYDDVPESVIKEADRAAWVLVGVGVVLAAASFAVRPRRRRVATKSTKTGRR